MSTETTDIRFETQGVMGLITLNRPKALNSLNLGMVQAMRTQLKAWESDPAIACVVLRGEGDRAFCAGADIRAMRQSGLDGTTYAMDFLREEYLLNSLIKHYAKPYISLIRGICMGGGMGLSVHGAYRIASNSAVFAMPETAIGFFPDVGGSYFLSRCPGKLGVYLGLTGGRIDTADAIYARIATHWIPSDEWPVLLEALANGDDPNDLFSEMGRRPENSTLSDRRTKIDRIFGTTSVEDVLTLLDRDEKEWSHECAALMRTRSPSSLKIAFGQIRNGANLSFDECMKMEFRIAHHILKRNDFYEGVRAVIVDKDNAAKWQPATLADISPEDVQSYFAPIPDELPL